MRARSITIKNFLGYGDADATLDIANKDTFLIQGPNGVGKSTIFIAAVWALYGRAPVAVDEVVNRYTKKNCKVSYRFDVGSQEYTVIRYRKHDTHGNSVYIFKGDQNISHKNINETQQIIQDIVQIPYTAMVSSFYFSTELYTSFLRAKQAERLGIIESVLSLKEVSTYYGITRDLLKITENKYQDALKEKEKIQYGIEVIKSNIDAYTKKAMADLASLKKRKEEKTKAIEELQTKLETVNIEKELSLIAAYEKAVEDNKKIDEQIKAVGGSTDVTALEKKNALLQDELYSLKNVNVAKEKEAIKFKEKVEKENSEVVARIKELNGSIKDTDGIVGHLRTVSNEKDKILKEIESISRNICPLCGQSTNDEINEKIVSDKKKRLEAISLEIEELLKTEREVIDFNLKVEKEVEELKGNIQTVPFCEYSYDELDTIATKITDLEKELGVVQNKLDNSKNILKIIANLEEKKTSIPKSSSYSKSELDELKSSDAILESAKNELNEINKMAATLYDKEYVAELKGKIEKLEKAEKKSSKVVESIDEDKKYYTVLQDVMSNKEFGFKKFFINKIVKEFEKKINFYLPFFFDKSIEVHFDKDLNETIIYDGFQSSFGGFSSGQKTRIDLAIAFSLFMMVKAFFSTSINFIVFDEILDQNLDIEGVRAVMNIIDNLSQDSAVYIISHREEYKDKFKNRISVKESGGFSVLEQHK